MSPLLDRPALTNDPVPMAKIGMVGNARRNWRFPLFLAVLGAAALAGIPRFGAERGILASFDAAAVLFLLSCLPLFSHRAEDMRGEAAAADASRVVRLAISLLLSVVVFAAMTSQIAERAALTGRDKALVAASIVLVWTFANAIYMLHYAHLFYSDDGDGGDRGGLQFPGTGKPAMSDFAYFAFTIGVAVQTADVAISSPAIRRIVTIHAILGFFFNIGVLALTINVLGSV